MILKKVKKKLNKKEYLQMKNQNKFNNYKKKKKNQNNWKN